MVRCLALDLATATGFAYRCEHEGLVVGTWKLASAKEIKQWGLDRSTRKNDPRVKRLYDLVSALHSRFHFDVVAWEDVQFSSFTLQTQLWASLRTAVWLALQQTPRVPYLECVGVSTLKKFATGHGGATKEMMLKAAQKQNLLDDYEGVDDNGIDAAFLLSWAERNLARMFKV